MTSPSALAAASAVGDTRRVLPSRRALIWSFALMTLAVLPAIISGFTWIPWLAGLALLGLLCLVDLGLAPRPAQLALQLEAPAAAVVGAPITCHLAIGLPRLFRPLHLDALLETGHSLAPHTTTSFVLGASRPAPLAMTLHARRRGPARVSALRLRWTGPLGLVEWQTRMSVDTEIAVTLPTLRNHAPTAQLLVRTNQMGARIERYRGQGTEFDALNNYTPDHDHRRIDWKASARRAAPLVREYRAERNRDVIFALDTGHLMAQPLEGMPRLDHAILATQLLALAAARAGDRIGLFAFDAGPRTFIKPGPGMGAYAMLARATAQLHDTIEETNFTRCIGELTLRLRRRSLVVLVTDFVDSTTAEIMLEHLERLGRRHVLIFAVLTDPTLEAARSRAPTLLSSVHASVTADALSQERDRVFAHLRQSGAIVVEGTPENLSSRLLSRYMEVKRREQL